MCARFFRPTIQTTASGRPSVARRCRSALGFSIPSGRRAIHESPLRIDGPAKSHHVIARPQAVAIPSIFRGVSLTTGLPRRLSAPRNDVEIWRLVRLFWHSSHRKRSPILTNWPGERGSPLRFSREIHEFARRGDPRSPADAVRHRNFPSLRDGGRFMNRPYGVGVPGRTTRVLLDCRHAQCTTVWFPALPHLKNHRPPPCSTTRVLLAFRQVTCRTVWFPALPGVHRLFTGKIRFVRCLVWKFMI